MKSSSLKVKFATTRWSLVASASEPLETRQKALEELCKIYWPPLYAYLRQHGYSQVDAQDLTQSFLLELLTKNSWAKAKSERGRFRSFLLGCLKHFLSHEREKKQAKKRGGNLLHFRIFQNQGEQYFKTASREPSPEKLYEKAWQLTVLNQVMERFLEEMQSTQHKIDNIQLLICGLSGKVNYPDMAEQYGISVAAMRQKVTRLRKRYQLILLEEINRIVLTPEEVQEEICYLFSLAGH